MENKGLENGADSFDKLKRKKQSLDIKYKEILDRIKSTKDATEIIKCQKELIKLSKEYDTIAQKLKEE